VILITYLGLMKKIQEMSVYSDKVFTKGLIFLFSIFTIVLFVCGFFNPWHFALSGLCLFMVIIGIVELKNLR
jgi:hypothetical protein